MSYLSLPLGLADFRKGVISLWFRLPLESLDAVREAGDAMPLGTPFRYIMPLFTFGDPLTQHAQVTNFENVANPVGFTPDPPIVILSPTSFTITGEETIEPSHVGINCAAEGVGYLVMNWQMAGRAVLTHIGDQISLIDLYRGEDWVGDPPDMSPGTGWGTGPDETYAHTISTVDVSDARNARPEYFFVNPNLALAADTWHHILLSFDFSNACTTHGPPQLEDPDGTSHANTAEGTDSACQFWYAVDDLDYRESDDALGPYYVDGGSGNEILTENAWDVANDVTGLIGNLWGVPSSCDFGPEDLPTADSPLGIPAAPVWVDNIYAVEMAEFQMFTGVTLDTGIEDNRRAFVAEDGTPMPPAAAEALLEQKPAVLLHGSGHWIAGINSGEPAAPEEPAPPLTPTGLIVAYTPGPDLSP